MRCHRLRSTSVRWKMLRHHWRGINCLAWLGSQRLHRLARKRMLRQRLHDYIWRSSCLSTECCLINRRLNWNIWRNCLCWDRTLNYLTRELVLLYEGRLHCIGRKPRRWGQRTRLCCYLSRELWRQKLALSLELTLVQQLVLVDLT